MSRRWLAGAALVVIPVLVPVEPELAEAQRRSPVDVPDGRRGVLPSVDELAAAVVDPMSTTEPASGAEPVVLEASGDVPEGGGSIAGTGITVDFAVGDSALAVTVSTIASSAISRSAAPAAFEGEVVLVAPFEVVATDASGNGVHALAARYSIEPGDPELGLAAEAIDVVPGARFEIAVPADALTQVDPSTVRLMTRETDADAWTVLPSYLDGDRGVVIAESDHLSQFVVIGTPAVAPTGPCVALDPDDDVGFADWPADGHVTELPLSVATAAAVKVRLETECNATVLVTRDLASPPVVSRATRVGQINAFGSVASVTLAYNALSGVPWGNAGNGGATFHGLSPNVGNETLAGQLATEWVARTGRPNQWLGAFGVPYDPDARYPEFAAVTGSHAHVELGFMDHNVDWPVIRDRQADIVEVVFQGLAAELARQGYACTGAAPSGLPARPDAAALARYRRLGLQNGHVHTGDPVSIPSGNLVEQIDVASLPGPGSASIDVSLTYNSLDDRVGRFGLGVWSSIDARAQRFADGGVMIVRGDGASFVFEPDGAGGYVTPPGGSADLFEAGSGRLRLEVADGSTLVFDASGPEGIGWLQSVTFVDGQTLTYTYGAPSVTAKLLPLASITDSAGQAVTFGSDADGRVTSVTLPDGRAWSFAYTAAGELASITDPLGRTRNFTYDAGHRMATLTDAAGVTYLTNSYDATGRVIGQVDALGNMRSWEYLADRVVYTNAEGVVTEHGFDGDGNVTTVTDPAGATSYTFDAAGLLAAMTDAEGRVTSYTYDADGNVLSSTDPAGATVSYTYNAAGLVTSLTDQGGIAGAARTETNTYDAAGLPIATTSADGTQTTRTYTAAGDLATVTDPLGAVDRYEYDARGNMVGHTNPLGDAWVYGYDLGNQLVSITAPNGAVTRYAYDAAGNLVNETAPDGGVRTRTYDAWNRMTSETDAVGNTTRFEHDLNGRIVRVVAPDGAATTMEYNAEDVLTRSTDPLGRATAIALDPALRPVAVTDPNGGITRFTLDRTGLIEQTADALGGVSAVTYDLAGRPSRTSDPTGVAVSATYDANGRAVRAERTDGSGVDTLYDVVGRPAVVTYADGTSEGFRYDAAGNVTEYIDRAGFSWLSTYSAIGQLLTETDPLGGVTTYTYSNVGDLISIRDATGATVRYEYDLAGDLVAETATDGTVTRYTHDLLGRVVTSTDPAGAVTSFEYDARGQMVASTNAIGATTRYTFDAAGQLVSTTDPRGVVTAYTYDALGQVVREVRNAQPGVAPSASVNVTTTFVRDALGRVVSSTDPNGNVTTYRYDAAGRRTSSTDPLGRVTSTAYDTLGRPARVTLPDGTAIDTGYDELDRVVSEQWSSGHSRHTAYDAAGRLASVADASGTAAYTYDPLGRLLREQTNFGATDYTYDLAGRETSRLLADGTEVETGHDVAGRVDSLTMGSVSVGYGYDAAGRIASLTRSNGSVTSYGYDALSRLTEQTVAVPAGARPDQRNSYTPTSQGPERDLIDWGYARLAVPDSAVTDGAWTEQVTYDVNDNITSSTKSITGYIPNDLVTPGVDVTPGSVSDTYSYDALNRLSGSVSNGVTTSYRYDANGNRVGMVTSDDPTTFGVVDPTTLSASFDAANQISTMTTTRPTGTSSTGYTYDARGQRAREVLSRPDGSSFVTGWSYDELGRLTGVDRVQRSTRIVRDVAGRAASVTAVTPEATTVSEIAYDGWEPGAVVQPAHRDVSVLSDLAGSPLVEVDDVGEQRWLVSSIVGGVTASVNASGAITELSDAADYGSVVLATDRWAAMNGGSGELSLVSGDNVSLFHQRAYQPGSATWNQADALWSGNRHSYAAGNPSTLIDRFGFDPDSQATIRARAHQYTAQVALERARNRAGDRRGCSGGARLMDGRYCVGGRTASPEERRHKPPATKTKPPTAGGSSQVPAPHSPVMAGGMCVAYCSTTLSSHTPSAEECLLSSWCTGRQLTDALMNSGLGSLVFDIIDVAKQGDIGKRNGDWSADDIAAAIAGKNLARIIADLGATGPQAAQLEAVAKSVAGRLQHDEAAYEAIDSDPPPGWKKWLAAGTVAVLGYAVAGAFCASGVGCGIGFFLASATTSLVVESANRPAATNRELVCSTYFGPSDPLQADALFGLNGVMLLLEPNQEAQAVVNAAAQNLAKSHVTGICR